MTSVHQAARPGHRVAGEDRFGLEERVAVAEHLTEASSSGVSGRRGLRGETLGASDVRWEALRPGGFAPGEPAVVYAAGQGFESPPPAAVYVPQAPHPSTLTADERLGTAQALSERHAWRRVTPVAVTVASVADIRYACGGGCGRLLGHHGDCPHSAPERPTPARPATGRRTLFACTTCGKVIDHRGRCDDCPPRRRLTTTQRGDGADHQRRRAVRIAGATALVVPYALR
jgi:hypothetical protein